MFHMFDTDTKDKVEVRVIDGTQIVEVGEAATVTREFAVIGERIDFRNYMVIGVMSGHGNTIGYTDLSGNPITPQKVVNEKVYPSAEFEMSSNKRTLKINLYNDASSGRLMWYRVILMKVTNEY